MARISKDLKTVLENYDGFTGHPVYPVLVERNWEGFDLTDEMVNNVSIFFSDGEGENAIPEGYYEHKAIAYLNLESFGAIPNDSSIDNTAAIQRAVDAAYLEGKVIFVPRNRYYFYGTVYTPRCIMFIGQNYGPLAYDNQRQTQQQPLSRLVFMTPNGVAFLPKSVRDGLSTRGFLRLILDKVGITYGDNYFASETNRTSATCFKQCTFAGHSLIEGTQINGFNIFFDDCSFGQGIKVVKNTFREIGEYFAKQCIFGDAFFTTNYFNGSVWAKNGAICFDSTTVNMTMIQNNWFEFFNAALLGPTSNNAIITGNIFDYTFRPVEGFGFLANISNNGFNHLTKTSALVRFRNIDEDNIMRTGDWVPINITRATGHITIMGNIGQAVELEPVRISSTGGSYGELHIEGNSWRSNSPISGDDSIRLTPPSGGGAFIGVVRCSALMYNVVTSYPQKNLFDGRVVLLNGIIVVYNRTLGTWIDARGEQLGFGNSNFLLPLTNAAWVKPTTGIANQVIGTSGYDLSFTASASNRFYTYNIPFVLGDVYSLSLDAMTSTSGTITPNFEIRLMSSTNTEIGKLTFPTSGKKLIDINSRPDVASISYLQIRIGGGGSTTTNVTYTFTNIQMYKYQADTYATHAWYNGVKERVTAFVRDKQLPQRITGAWTFTEGIRTLSPDGSEWSFKINNDGTTSIVKIT